MALSSVINNGLSFVGFNATASLYKGKLHSSERPYPPPFMPCKGARKRRRLSERALVIAVACIWIKSSGLSWSFRIDKHAQIVRTDLRYPVRGFVLRVYPTFQSLGLLS